MQNQLTGTSPFTRNTKMCTIVHTNYHLLSVINNFGVKLGFGDKTIESLCAQENIDIDCFLTVLNVYTFPEYIPEIVVSKSYIENLVSYYKNTHEYYLNAIIPTLKDLINQLTINQFQTTQSALIRRFHEEYVSEVEKYILFNDQFVFSYLQQLHNSEIKLTSKLKKENVTLMVNDFKLKNTIIERKLFDLKNILLKYFSTPDDDLVIHILYLLFRFEMDFQDHSTLEQKVLIPILKEL
jgi:regulator of cell morphogenesis and NO signaling